MICAKEIKTVIAMSHTAALQSRMDIVFMATAPFDFFPEVSEEGTFYPRRRKKIQAGYAMIAEMGAIRNGTRRKKTSRDTSPLRFFFSSPVVHDWDERGHSLAVRFSFTLRFS
jgi:hypothetical protein